jgi:DNA-binding IclR family transcriptional regulator
MKPAAGATREGQFGVQSVEIGLRVLSALVDARHPVMLKDIAKSVNMPAAKVHRYLVSLIRAGMVDQNGSGGRYELGSFALNVGLAAFGQLDFVRIAGAAAAELRDRTDQTSMLAVWGSYGPTIVHWEECRRPIAVSVRVGSVLRLLDSATGLVFAAFLPRDRTAEMINAGMVNHDRAAVEKELTKIRTRGLARVRGQQLASVNALSAPVFDHTNKIVAAITLLGPESQFNTDWDGSLALELRSTCIQTSKRLGATTGMGSE